MPSPSHALRKSAITAWPAASASTPYWQAQLTFGYYLYMRNFYRNDPAWRLCRNTLADPIDGSEIEGMNGVRTTERRCGRSGLLPGLG